jgi:hypothetical protein
MQLLLHLFMGGRVGHGCSKHVVRLGDQLLLPVLDLIGMYSKLLGSFSQGAVPPDSSQCYFGLEGWGMIPSRSFGHLLLLSLKEIYRRRFHGASEIFCPMIGVHC